MSLRVLATLVLLSHPAGAECPDPTPFFAHPRTVQLTVSPAGTYAAQWIVEGEDHFLAVHHLDPRAVATLESATEIAERLRWADDDTLLLVRDRGPAYVLGEPGALERTQVVVIDVRFDGGEVKLHQHAGAPFGSVVHPLPAHDDVFLFTPWRQNGSVYRVPLAELPHRAWRRPENLAALFERHVLDFVADREGRVRAAVVPAEGEEQEEPRLELWYRAAGQSWRVVDSMSALEPDLMPLAFGADGRHLLVASDRGRDRYGIFHFDPDAGALGDLLYEHPRAQIVGGVLDYDQAELLSVSYLEDGALRYHYFDSILKRHRQTLRNTFPGHTIAVDSVSRDGGVLAVLTSSATDPGRFHLFHVGELKVQKIASVAPWLSSEMLTRVDTFSVESDGFEIEAFAAHPRDLERAPLLVMPHGGPLGVWDESGFDPVSQYLASAGFAVLRVNYRGSGGYGRRFLNAGKREWGRGIEDDVAAAVARVLAGGRVDRERVCAIGGSYGGYSALMSLVREPELYDCAAVWAPVTDLPLLFNSSGLAATEWGRELLVDLIGDPEREYEQLASVSPVYRSSDIRAPLFLGHGVRDTRVDIEHSRRLALMFELRGQPVELYTDPASGHSPASPAHAATLWKRVCEFVTASLEEVSSPPGAP